MDTLLQDLRYGIRLLVKRPGFTVVAIITLALGIGANTAIFSVVNAVLLRPLPYPEPERLVTLRSNQSLPDLDDIKAQSQSFESLGGAVMQAQDFTGEAEPLQVQAALVNADLFKALGARAAIGRTISEEEDRFGGEPVVVLSHGFWQRHFGGAPDVIGKTVPLSGNSYTVIGVMPADFTMPRENPDLWAAVRVANPVAARFRGVHFLRTYFRLKPGVSIAQAHSEMENTDRWLEQQYPEENKNRRTELIPLHERVVGSTRPALLILFGAVGLVLLIACANFANLLLARAAARQQEIVIRAALGAARRRLVRQMVTESVLLSALGGAFGLVLATWGIDLLVALKPANLPRLSAIGIDLWVLAFTFGVSILTGILFGLAPALSASHLDVNEVLKEGGRGGTGGGASHLLRRLLVISEIALALVLLIGAGLLIKGLWLLRSVDPGFRAENILTMRVELPESRYKEIPKQTAFRQGLIDGLSSLPGVEASMISELPLSGDQLTHNFIIEGRPPLVVGEEPELMTRTVGGDYFRVMSIPLLQGRDFTAQDRGDTPAVGLVNESFAREYFPGENPIGARISWARGPRQWMTIIGVVGDVKHSGLNQPEEPAFYSSYAQLNQPWKRWMYLAVRSSMDTSTLTNEVKKQIWAIDKLIPVTRVQTMTQVMAASIAGQQFNMTLMGIFAGVALALAAVGIYGVTSYSVTQRTREIGIRMALGAQGRDVLKLILRQGAALAGTGVAIGLAAAVALTRLMSSLLYGVSATDPLTFAVISLLLTGVALGACFVPARRATKVDPGVALRHE
ncbi:MAG TPA: ABC transporter permease [Blastocatellia bacterium]|jgi:putative ABC transport system permease protein|nr:ABC transporter permease [Blastocatellia bacterium]